MDNLGRLRGTELRYVLTIQLFDHGAVTVNDLVDALSARGFRVSAGATRTEGTHPPRGLANVKLSTSINAPNGPCRA
jgi:hypothetical protein